MQSDWVTWALQFVLMLAVSRVWIALDENTRAITQLRIDIPTNYATKLEVERHNMRDEDHHVAADLGVRILTDRVHALDLRLVKAELGRPSEGR